MTSSGCDRAPVVETARLRSRALLDPDNAPSIKLALKFGFTQRARTICKDSPMIQYEFRRPA